MIHGFKQYPEETIVGRDSAPQSPARVSFWVGEDTELKRLRLVVNGDVRLTLHQARQLIDALEKAIAPDRVKHMKRLAANRRRDRQVEAIRSIEPTQDGRG